INFGGSMKSISMTNRQGYRLLAGTAVIRPGGKMMKRRKTVDTEMAEHFSSLIRRRINIVLEMMYERPNELVDLESGEKYICSVCDMEHKRCESEPDYRCEIARKRETEFKELELALDRLKKRTYGYCENCSNFIGKRELEKSLTRTFCDGCAGKN
ncbi:MAG TPA: hypothetical protein PL001_12840, partial [Candidatus Kryptobacter bacterium]|nr:hypothetical protein [Candidatus Kryptobacter bacterium]